MEVTLAWESVETYNVENQKFKEFLYNATVSLNDQLIDKDFHLSLNNNKLDKIMLNNQIKDLAAKFHGNNFEVTLSKDSEKEIEELTKSCKENQSLNDKISSDIVTCRKEVADSTDFSQVEKKLSSLIKPFDQTNNYHQKIKEKIIKKFSMYDDVFKESPEIKQQMMKVKTNSTLMEYNKLINHSLKEMFEFVYVYGILFVEDKEAIKKFCDAFKNVFKKYLMDLNVDIKESLKTKESYLNNKNDYDNLFDFIENSLIGYRVMRYVDPEPPSTVFHSFDEPVNVKFSEMEYKEIKGLLSQFPSSLAVLKADNPNMSDADLNDEMFLWAFIRDIRIFDIYGIRMEDFIYGYLLYEN